jgi:hypothetical protein
MKTKTIQKMKKPLYKTASLLFISAFIASFTATGEEVTKEFHKEFNSGANTILNISNRYGDVVIEKWDKDQIKIDVKVTVEHPSQDRAEKLLSYIDVQFDETGDVVSAKTVIDDKFSFTGWSGDSKEFSIDYTVKMPAGNTLQLANKYGDTEIDELSGEVTLDIKYGNLTAGKLTRGNVKPLSRISIAYGKGSIEEAGWLDLMVRYASKMEINRSQALLLDSKYSKIALGETSSLVGQSKYDNIRIENIKNLVLENGYTETNIQQLTKKLSYTGSYGSFTVEEISPDFDDINVETRYMGVKIGIPESASYNLDSKVSYGSLKYNEDNFRNQRRIVENNSSEITGIVGKSDSPKANVKIKASYGSVRLY